uniref:Secreted protein n=1 Tax=Steinernema glaseri TaxID=37863 RepID=A0A1I8A7A6_9BILA
MRWLNVVVWLLYGGRNLLTGWLPGFVYYLPPLSLNHLQERCLLVSRDVTPSPPRFPERNVQNERHFVLLKSLAPEMRRRYANYRASCHGADSWSSRRARSAFGGTIN